MNLYERTVYEFGDADSTMMTKMDPHPIDDVEMIWDTNFAIIQAICSALADCFDPLDDASSESSAEVFNECLQTRKIMPDPE